VGDRKLLKQFFSPTRRGVGGRQSDENEEKRENQIQVAM
jgi:hypothetical protein